jgi:hypothetical protein
LGGLTFHVLSAQLLGISFAPLWLCYGLLVDWNRVDAWLRSDSAPPQLPRTRLAGWRRAPGVSAIGLVACAGFAIEGLRGQSQSWPWACYPTFQWIVPGEQRDVLATVSDPPATYPSPRQARRRSQREWGSMYRLLGAYGDSQASVAEARCAYARQLVEAGSLPRARAGSTEVTLIEVRRSTVPEHWNDAPAKGRTLTRCSVP